MKNSGSTGVTILILNEGDKRVVYSANAGDSRSIIFSDGETKRLSYVPCFMNLYDIVQDHKAIDESEERRINNLGGFIMNKRVIGILAVSRSFGDHSCKRYVTAKPYVNRMELTENSEFIVLACDGVYDVLEDADVAKIVKREVKEVVYIIIELINREMSKNVQKSSFKKQSILVQQIILLQLLQA